MNQTPSPKNGVVELQPQSTNPKIETHLETTEALQYSSELYSIVLITRIEQWAIDNNLIVVITGQ